VIELGLAIAGFTYGGSARGVPYRPLHHRLTGPAPPVALLVCVFTMAAIIFLGNIAWPWYTLIGVAIFFTTADCFTPDPALMAGFLNRHPVF
jgi:hypothetical protein